MSEWRRFVKPLHAGGMSIAAIAKHYGQSWPAVWRVATDYKRPARRRRAAPSPPEACAPPEASALPFERLGIRIGRRIVRREGPSERENLISLPACFEGRG